jgi:GR25 family glycosyltransferase involved in LPS biosynthesis
MNHFWINLEKSIHRKKYMETQFDKNNIINTRVPAFTPNDFEDYLSHDGPISCKHPGCQSCQYEFACLMSHIKAMQMGIESGDDYFIILEDDICLPFVIDYEKLIEDIPKDTEILQMLVLYGNSANVLYDMYISRDIKFIKWKYLLPSAGMYMISREGAKKLVELFFQNGKYNFSSSPYQIVADVLLYETAKTYVTTIPYAYPECKLGSTIHPDHIKEHQKAVNVIKDIIKRNIPYIKKKLL